MEQSSPPLIIKFGSSSLKGPKSFHDVSQIVLERARVYKNLVVVISAMQDMTSALAQMAHQISPSPPKRELDMLMTAGERVSIALLAVALSHCGLEARSFTGSQSGIITTSDHQEALITAVKPVRIWDCFREGKVAIVAGFQGVSDQKEITTLGRGGSDYTAVALARALNASHVEFYKDVPGFFEKDPKLDPAAKQYLYLSYKEALSLAQSGAKVVQARAIEEAEKGNVSLFVLSYKTPAVQGTWIGMRRREVGSE